MTNKKDEKKILPCIKFDCRLFEVKLGSEAAFLSEKMIEELDEEIIHQLKEKDEKE
jgi:hypothetical protein